MKYCREIVIFLCLSQSWISSLNGCGTRPSDVPRGRNVARKDVKQVFLLGGTETRANSWPWMVSIHRRRGQSTQFVCGGCIITDRYILTAAHCFVENRSPANYLVKVAGHRRNEGNDYRIKKIQQHRLYRPRVHYYDIALLQVERRINFDRRTSPACLPSSRQRYGNGTTTVLGWGDTSFGGLPSERLQEANVKIVSNRVCNNSYNRLNLATFPKGITGNMICAGKAKGGVDACQGDSGGPLMLRDSSRWKVIGIVSFGYQCGIAEYPGVYTRVSKFLRWISKHTK